MFNVLAKNSQGHKRMVSKLEAKALFEAEPSAIVVTDDTDRLTTTYDALDGDSKIAVTGGPKNKKWFGVVERRATGLGVEYKLS